MRSLAMENISRGYRHGCTRNIVIVKQQLDTSKLDGQGIKTYKGSTSATRTEEESTSAKHNLEKCTVSAKRTTKEGSTEGEDRSEVEGDHTEGTS